MSRFRVYCASKIPALAVRTFITDTDIAVVEAYGPLHRFLMNSDIAWGVWGTHTPSTTISGRCGKTLQLTQVAHPFGWSLDAPMWALALGAFLETIDPGHLQGAMDADLARQVAGILYLTGIRVLAPPKDVT